MLGFLAIWRRRWKGGTAIPPPLDPPNPVSVTVILDLMDTTPKLTLMNTVPLLRETS